jgi:hypothetical protein
MKNNIKKLVMAATTFGFALILGSTVQVKADTDITDASAKIVDGSADISYVNKDVYKITLPTDDAIIRALSYQADPQGLVEDTSAAQFGNGITIGANEGIFFKNSSGGTVTGISGTSDPFVITNKSSSGVTLGIDAKLVNATTETYSGGFSTTKDFSGNSDKGLYIGLTATGEIDERALSNTAASFSGVAISAADKYEVSWDNSNSKYKYDLTASASGFPTYEFTLEGALNHDVDDTVWMSSSGTTVTAKNMPTVQLKYTPSLISGNKGLKFTILNGTDFYIAKETATSAEDGGFGSTKPSAIIVNGKPIPTASIRENAYGFVYVTWDDVCVAYGYDNGADPDIDVGRGTSVYNGPIAFQIKWNGSDYYGELVR